MTELKTADLKIGPDPLVGAAPDDNRTAWRQLRAEMEKDGRRFTRSGPTRSLTLPRAMRAVEDTVAALGLKRQALANIRAVDVTEAELFFTDLPAEFDGYLLMHLTDLHVGRVPGLLARAAERIRGRAVDLAVITGDFQSRGWPAADEAALALAPLVDTIEARDGIVAVLGNHDSHALVEPLESISGVQVLVNEHMTVERQGKSLLLTGLDDVNYFYTAQAEQTLRGRSGDAFGVALVHSPEMADVAAESGYSLYLCGHTHGGQICLPGGRPVMTATDRHRDLASGVWQCGGMLGYTSRGVGVIHRARFNCPPEIALLRLRRA